MRLSFPCSHSICCIHPGGQLGSEWVRGGGREGGGLSLTCRSSNWLHCTLDRIWQSTNVQRLMCPAARRTCRLSFQLRCLFVCFRMYSLALYICVWVCTFVWLPACVCLCVCVLHARVHSYFDSWSERCVSRPPAWLVLDLQPNIFRSPWLAIVGAFPRPARVSIDWWGSRNFNYISHNLRNYPHTHNILLAHASIRCLKISC